MTIFYLLVNVVLIAFVARRLWLQVAKSDSIVYWSAFAARLSAGILLGLFYQYYYNGQGDTFVFFEDAIQFVKGNFGEVTSEPRSLFFIYVVAGINQLTGNNYWITSLWFSLFVFLSSYRLVVQLDHFYPALRMPARAALLFLPSVLFWSSGVIKESLAFGAVIILVFYFVGFINSERITAKSVVEIALALILLLNLKYYWAAVLLPSMITALIVKKISPSKFLAVWYAGVFILLCLAVSFTHPNFYLSRFLSVIVDNNHTYAGENIIHYYDLSPGLLSILINSPLALFSGLFRPLLEFSSMPAILASLENVTILSLFIWKIIFASRPYRLRSGEPGRNRVIVIAVLTYIIVLCIFLALSTPNLGTLSRYRVGFLSFFVLLILADHPILKFINGKSSNHIRS
jgi:hypothetical protein